jgi:hypothetical protein
LINSPKPGQPSYELFQEERTALFEKFQRSALITQSELDGVPGLTCNDIKAGFYAFPEIKLPTKVINTAQESGRSATY